MPSLNSSIPSLAILEWINHKFRKSCVYLQYVGYGNLLGFFFFTFIIELTNNLISFSMQWMEIFIDNNQICDMNIFLSEDYKPMFINILKMSFNNWILTVVPSLIDFFIIWVSTNHCTKPSTLVHRRVLETTNFEALWSELYQRPWKTRVLTNLAQISRSVQLTHRDMRNNKCYFDTLNFGVVWHAVIAKRYTAMKKCNFLQVA